MTRTTITTALLAALSLASPTFAQDGAQPAKPQCDDGRTLRHADAEGTSELCAKKEGEAWRVELTRCAESANGASVERRFQLMFPASAEADRELDALFAEAPQDPAEWERRLEEIADVEIDLDLPRKTLNAQEGDDDDERGLGERMKQEMREALEQLREMIRDRVGGGDEEAATTTGADVVTLKSGERVTGEVISTDEETVRVKLEGGDVRAIARADVKRIELAEASDETAQDGQHRPTLGVAVVPAENGGVRVERVTEGSPAAKAGLMAQDVIVSFDDQAVRDPAHLRQLIGEATGDEPVVLGVQRGRERLDLQVDLKQGLSAHDRQMFDEPY
jgi:hypothetical protein